MRVVLVTHYFPAHRGGVELVAGILAKHLGGKGRFEICWFASDTDPTPLAQTNLEYVRTPSTNFIERRLKLPYPLWSPGIIPKLWRSIRTADVVHVHDFIYCGSLLAFAIARFQSKPVVVTQHVGFIPYESLLLRKLQGFLNRTLGALLLGQVHSVVFISSAVLHEFASFVRFRRAPRLVFNGVDTKVYSPACRQERLNLRTFFGFEESDFVLLFVGRFIEKKGLAILKQLVEFFPAVEWIFAGTGPMDPGNWGFANVTVHREKQGEELAELYCASDLLVLPSKGEGFPLVVQESMACGTPALIAAETVTAVPGLKDHCFAEEVLVPDVVIRWRSAIAALLAEKNKLDRMRNVVATFARASWSWEECVEQYADIFAEVDSERNDADRPTP